MDNESKLEKVVLTWCKNNLTLDTTIDARKLTFKGYSDNEVFTKIVYLVEDGLIDAIGYQKNDYRDVLIKKLTPDGMARLRFIQENTGIKGFLKSAGNFSKWVIEVFIKGIVAWLFSQFGNK